MSHSHQGAQANQSTVHTLPRPLCVGKTPEEIICDNYDKSYLLAAVTPGQVSVRNGEAGRPALLYRLQTGLSAQA